jgi:DNA-binding winged helix-turn-helix (wHTH) protein/tetratricopeptide (TPR) repeat protein
MALETRSPEILRFGAFEVNLRSGELRKQGVRIKLQEQPFQVLANLLQRPGDVVTREELRSAIWQSDTFVDFDNGLNTSINKLREALGDSADSPRFVETLPRRGYRFIAPMTGDRQEPPGAGTETAGAESTRRWKMIAVLVILAAGSVSGGVMLWSSRQSQKLTEKDTIVLADFANATGDPVFDDTLKQGLRVQLEQSPFLNILSDEKVAEELQLMGRTKDERLTKDLARDLCQRVGSKAILAGSISSLGTHYVIGLRALNCRSRDGLGSEQAEAEGREHVLKALGESATRMRKKRGESLPSIQKYDAPVEQATTPSLDALKSYTLGLRTWAASGAHKALPFFQRAVELDSKFAMAYGRLAVAFSAAGDAQLSADNMRKAYELRGRVSERERLYLESHNYHVATGELEKAAQAYELWKQIYPRDRSPYDNLQNVYSYQGRQEEALAEGLEALRLQPNNVTSYEDVIVSYLCVNRPDNAQAALQ